MVRPREVGLDGADAAVDQRCRKACIEDQCEEAAFPFGAGRAVPAEVL
jgi:hypothetical protein